MGHDASGLALFILAAARHAPIDEGQAMKKDLLFSQTMVMLKTSFQIIFGRIKFFMPHCWDSTLCTTINPTSSARRSQRRL